MIDAIDLAIGDDRARATGPRLEHIALDDSDSESGDWSPAKELENARAAVDDPSVVAYVGPYNTGATAVSLPVTSRAGLLQIGPTATWPGLTVGGWDPGEPDKYYAGTRNFVRLMPPDSKAAQAAAQWAEVSGAKRVLVLSDGSSYSNGLASEFEKEARRLGIAIAGKRDVAHLTVSPVDADAVFYAPSTVSQAARAAKLLATAAPGAIVYATDTALSDQFLAAAGDGARNWRLVHNGLDSLPPSAAADNFDRKFRDAYEEAPGQFATNAYDAASMVARAMQGGATDRKTILEAVLSMRDYARVGGPISLDSHGDNTTWRLTGYEVADGIFTSTVVLSNTNTLTSR